MDTFINTFGVIGAFCLGIIILAIFFTGLGYIKNGFGGPKIIKMRNFVGNDVLVNVHLTGGKTLERMKWVGFTDGGSVKGHIPFQLTNMVVLENEQGLKTLLRSDSIKLIEEIGVTKGIAMP